VGKEVRGVSEKFRLRESATAALKKTENSVRGVSKYRERKQGTWVRLTWPSREGRGVDPSTSESSKKGGSCGSKRYRGGELTISKNTKKIIKEKGVKSVHSPLEGGVMAGLG